jgi:hypothetical protein
MDPLEQSPRDPILHQILVENADPQFLANGCSYGVRRFALA